MKFYNHRVWLITLISVVSGIFLVFEINDRIVLDPDQIDEFTLDPAEFDPNDEDAKIFRYSKFGRKDEAVYKQSTREEDGAPIIEASSNGSISTVTTPLTADPEVFKFIEWKWKIESVLPPGTIKEKMVTILQHVCT